MSYQLNFEAEPFREIAELDPASRPFGRQAYEDQELAKASKGRIRRHPRFGYILSVPRARVSKEFGEIDQEIFPPDTRVAVLDTTKVPHRWICRLELEFDDPDNPGEAFLAIGTGTLISPRHVLTAGHNLLPDQGPAKGTAASRITVTPGYNCAGKTNSPFGSTTSAAAKAHPKWIDSQDKRFDIGVITLKSAIGATKQSALGGSPLGFWGSKDDGADTRINATDPKKLKGITANIAGYPTDKCCFKPLDVDTVCGRDSFAGAQFLTFGKIVSAAPPGGESFLLHRLDVNTGNSGSPIWMQWEKYRNLIGIHLGELTSADGSATINSGLRITDDLMKDVRALMK